MSTLVDVESRDGIAMVFMNRPAALNALSAALFDEMDAAIAAVAKSDARVFVLGGRGERAFCAGADIKEFKPAATTVEVRAGHYRRDVYARIESLPIPTIAAVHGYTLGGGAELSLACDLRIAADDTIYGFPETGLGTFPGAGGTQRLPRVIGYSAALWLVASGEKIDANEALRLGLVNCVVPKAALQDKVLEVAGRIAANAPLGVRYAKESMVRGREIPLVEAIRIEKDLNMFMDTTADYAEAAKAFVERRKPKFEGR